MGTVYAETYLSVMLNWLLKREELSGPPLVGHKESQRSTAARHI